MRTCSEWSRNKGFHRAFLKKAATDGTVVGTVRSPRQARGRYIAQGEVYFGHKKKHCIAYQAVGMPDGVVAYIFEPVPARQHDRYGFAQSTLPEENENLWKNTNRYDVFYMFGDSAYRNYRGVMRNYGRDECLTDAQRQVQSTLNKARTFVEWFFAEVASLFPFVGDLKLTPRRPQQALYQAYQLPLYVDE